MGKGYILVIDEGTTGVRALIYNENLEIKGEAYKRIHMLYPGEGEVEQDPIEIYEKTVDACREVVKKINIDPNEIKCATITNQRTSWLLWNKETGKPLRNMVTWLDSRGRFQKEKFVGDPVFNEKFPGLAPYLPDFYMPLVLERIKDTEEGFEEELHKSTTLWGNVDSWLLFKLTGGKVHATSASTASNSTVYISQFMIWYQDMLNFVGIREEMLPVIKEESDEYGVMDAEILGVEIPIYGAIADQQAALFSQGCIKKNTGKCTNGTGTFVDVNIGEKYVEVAPLITTVAWKLDNKISYMLEGISYTSGACLEWAKDNLKLFDDFNNVDEIAQSVENNGGIYFVPALMGLMGIPYDDSTARGAYMGITPMANQAHFTRATLESIAFATANIIEIATQAQIPIEILKLSGGASKSDVIAQLTANIVPAKVIRAKSVEATALGAAEMGALKLGWMNLEDVERFSTAEKIFEKNQKSEIDSKNFSMWKKAVERTLKWT